MTAHDANRDSEEHELLSAALLAQTGRALGEPPTDTELTAWLGNKLSGTVLQRVESHIAHDPSVFARAMSLREVSARKPARRWPKLRLPALATMTGAAPATLGILAVLLLMMVALLRSEDPLVKGQRGVLTGDTPVLRSAPDLHPDWRVAAFRTGFEQHAGGTPAPLDAATVVTGSCMDGDDCARLAAILAEFGGLVSTIESRCQSGGPDAVTRPSLAARLRDMDTRVAGSIELAAWRGHLDGLAIALEAGGNQACARSAALRELFLAD